MRTTVTSVSEGTNTKTFAIRKVEKTWANRILIFSVVGLVSLILGLVLSVLASLGFFGHQQWVAPAGVCVFLIAFVCAAIIAHLLDKADEEVRAVREGLVRAATKSKIYEEWPNF